MGRSRALSGLLSTAVRGSKLPRLALKNRPHWEAKEPAFPLNLYMLVYGLSALDGIGTDIHPRPPETRFLEGDARTKLRNFKLLYRAIGEPSRADGSPGPRFYMARSQVFQNLPFPVLPIRNQHGIYFVILLGLWLSRRAEPCTGPQIISSLHRLPRKPRVLSESITACDCWRFPTASALAIRSQCRVDEGKVPERAPSSFWGAQRQPL